MIAIGCATNDERAFRASASSTIQILDDGGALLLRRHGFDSIDGPYNDMLATAAAREDLEAAILVHQDAVVTGDLHVMHRVRRLLATAPDVAVIGTDGGVDTREVAAVDGTLIVMSAWAVRNLRFDSATGGSIDASARDICLQARSRGQRVLAARLGVTRTWHAPAPADRRRELAALLALGRKWDEPC